MNQSSRNQRRSIRLKGYDYTSAGAYFVTICVSDRECVLGAIVRGEVQLSEAGRLVHSEWEALPSRFGNVELDQFVVMPNHFHGVVIILEGRGTARRAPTTVEGFGKPVPGSLPTIVRSFKSAATKRINEIRGTPGAAFWQRNYYEHIVRNEADLNRIRQYIVDNPARWDEDAENPARQR